MGKKEELIKEQEAIMIEITGTQGETFHHGHPLVMRLDEIEKELAKIEFSEFMRDFKAKDWLDIYRGEE